MLRIMTIAHASTDEEREEDGQFDAWGLDGTGDLCNNGCSVLLAERVDG